MSAPMHSVVSKRANTVTLTANVSNVETLIIRSFPGTATVLVTDANKGVVATTVTTTELNYIRGVTSALQNQLDSKANLNAASFTGPLSVTGNLTVLGNNCYHGNGAGLFGLQTSNLVGCIQSTNVAWVADLTLPSEYAFSGNGAGLFGLQTSNLVGCIQSTNVAWVADLALPSEYVYYGNGAGITGILAENVVGAITNVRASDIQWNSDLALPSEYAFSGNGGGLFGVHMSNVVGCIESTNVSWIADLTLPSEYVYHGNGAGITGILAENVVGGMTNVIASDIQWNSDLDLPSEYAYIGNGAGLFGLHTSNLVGCIQSTNVSWVADLTLPSEYAFSGNAAGLVGMPFSSIDWSSLDASRVLATDADTSVIATPVTTDELECLSGVTSAIQTQLDAKADLSGATFAGTVNAGDVYANVLTIIPVDNGCMASSAAFGSVSNTHTISSSQIDVACGGSGMFVGELKVFVTNGSTTGSNKSGFAAVSIMQTPAGFDVVPIVVHKNTNLATFQVGKGGTDVIVSTDAGCSVSWKFDGCVVRA